MQLVAAAHVHARARIAQRLEPARAVRGDADHGAGPVAERELEVLRAVASLAQLALAYEQHMLDLLAFGELTNEHRARTLEP